MKKMLWMVCFFALSLNAVEKSNSFETRKTDMVAELEAKLSCIKKTKSYEDLTKCRKETRKRMKAKEIKRLEKRIAKLKGEL